MANTVCLPGAHIRENVICFIPDALIRANMVILPAWYTHWSIYGKHCLPGALITANMERAACYVIAVGNDTC